MPSSTAAQSLTSIACPNSGKSGSLKSQLHAGRKVQYKGCNRSFEPAIETHVVGGWEPDNPANGIRRRNGNDGIEAYDPAGGILMGKVRGPASALPPMRLSSGAAEGAYKTAASPPTRLHNWAWRVVIAALATAWVSAIGHGASHSSESDRTDIFGAREARLPGLPPESHTVANNNMIAQLGWVPNLDGTAIAYDRQADRLVEGGRFRTDLSLDQTARALKISPSSIANPRAPEEIDPDAELFRAQSGVLTEKSKVSARKYQKQQLLEGTLPDPIVQECVITEFSFTLNRLKQPSDEEKAVLSAIVRAASEIMPAPDEKIHAVGLPREALEAGRVAVTPGMLPRTIPMTVPEGG
jgi:hypothetical protein